MPKVLILRTCKHDMTSHGGFRWPESGLVVAPDWSDEPECGGGLHGLLWGEGDVSLMAHEDRTAKWLVAEVESESIIDLEWKVKFPSAVVVHVGDKVSAPAYILANGGQGRGVHFGTTTAGYRGTATAGYRGTATAGDSGTATAGDSGTAVAGDSGTAVAGDRGTAVAGDRGTAVAGYRGTATAGDSGTATAGEDGVISVFWWDESAEKYRRAVGVIGENGLKPNVPYRLDSKGQWIEAPKPENKGA